MTDETTIYKDVGMHTYVWIEVEILAQDYSTHYKAPWLCQSPRHHYGACLLISSNKSTIRQKSAVLVGCLCIYIQWLRVTYSGLFTLADSRSSYLN